MKKQFLKKQFYNKRHRKLYAKFVELRDILPGSRLSSKEHEEYTELERKTNIMKDQIDT